MHLHLSQGSHDDLCHELVEMGFEYVEAIMGICHVAAMPVDRGSQHMGDVDLLARLHFVLVSVEEVVIQLRVLEDPPVHAFHKGINGRLPSESLELGLVVIIDCS